MLATQGEQGLPVLEKGKRVRGSLRSPETGLEKRRSKVPGSGDCAGLEIIQLGLRGRRSFRLPLKIKERIETATINYTLQNQPIFIN